VGFVRRYVKEILKELLNSGDEVATAATEDHEDILYGMDLAYWFYIGTHQIYFTAEDGSTRGPTAYIHYFIDKKFKRRRAILKASPFYVKRFKENHPFWYNYIPSWERATQTDSFLVHIAEMEYSKWALEYALEHHNMERVKDEWVTVESSPVKYEEAVKKQKQAESKIISVKEAEPESNVIKVGFGKKNEEEKVD